MVSWKKFNRRQKKHKKNDEPEVYDQQESLGGLLVTKELEKALEECKARVAEISQDCRRKNRRFRDIEFDLENDRHRCLHGISQSEAYLPSDVQRVTQIFDSPSFFIGGADSNDIVQGVLGDCWFLSALATMSTSQGLIEKFCVARDEKVGVYGFIFFRDNSWQVVIVDDLLYTSIPKFEELSAAEKHLYHNDKDQYNVQARKGSKSLYFAKSGTQGETWVPLIEKAYAKLHGDYAALSGGEAGEAIEDLTGGVTAFIATKDILDPDLFWEEELLKANTDRLFGCAFDSLDGTRSGNEEITVNGLFGSHAYSILRAVEVNGRRFVVIRNPWGKSEWTGPWSDGSGEWTPEWLSYLPEIGHSFGNDGQFIMEYSDFLSNWDQVDRTLLFDSSWVMSSQWLRVSARPLIKAWSFGDVSFTISVEQDTPAIIVLSKLDSRYYNEVSSRSLWSFDFIIYQKGEKTPYAYSSYSRFFARSVNLETHLEAGEYVVHVRLDRRHYRPANHFSELASSWSVRNAGRVLTQKSKGEILASNVSAAAHAPYLPLSLEVLGGSDLAELESRIIEKIVASSEPSGEEAGGEEEATTEEKEEEEKAEGGNEDGDGGEDGEAPEITLSNDEEEEDFIILGLRAYTKVDAPAAVSGQLRGAPAAAYSLLVEDEEEEE